jgi:hypothetical protein
LWIYFRAGRRDTARYAFNATLSLLSTSAATACSTGRLLCLAGLFLLALLPRLYSSQTVGWDWDYPGSFTLVNFDEAGSCRAALGGFEYSTFIGRQTIAIADYLGMGPDASVAGNAAAAKTYCHSAGHLRIARALSALTGALTVVMVSLITLMLLPSHPTAAWTAGALVALSGFHISESHSGTVDAPSVFFIYTFLAVMVYAVSRQRRWVLVASPLLLVPAVCTKYWVFALLAYVAAVPPRVWRYLSHGMSPRRVALIIVATAALFGMLSNSEFQQTWLYPLLLAWYLLIPWRRVQRPLVVFWLLLPLVAVLLFQVGIVASYTTGQPVYAAIGWNKCLRNLSNLPVILLLGLGLPACLFIPAGIRAIAASGVAVRAWWCLTPVLVFALYMAFLSPITYYRHYLPLIPAAAILAACGLHTTRWPGRRWFMILFFAWPALLALDLVSDYHTDPRIALRQWYAGHSDARVFASYYVNPPSGQRRNSPLFRPEYAFGDAAILRRAQYLILSENWFDTAFANELNGPLVDDLQRLVKTRPEYVQFYRDALAGRHPNLTLEQAIDVNNFMPELVLHKYLYGTFQLFVGDIRIFRVHD